MFAKKLILMSAVTMLVVAISGCHSGPRGPQVFSTVNGDPACPPGPKPCPREFPEFPLPPGGPYINTPPNVGTAPRPAAPAYAPPLNLQNSAAANGLTVKQQ